MLCDIWRAKGSRSRQDSLGRVWDVNCTRLIAGLQSTSKPFDWLFEKSEIVKATRAKGMTSE